MIFKDAHKKLVFLLLLQLLSSYRKKSHFTTFNLMSEYMGIHRFFIGFYRQYLQIDNNIEIIINILVEIARVMYIKLVDFIE